MIDFILWAMFIAFAVSIGSFFFYLIIGGIVVAISFIWMGIEKVVKSFK